MIIDKLTIIRPSKAHGAYKIAAELFAGLSLKTAGVDSEIITDLEAGGRTPVDCVVIGSDAVNGYTASLCFDKAFDSFGIRYGCDDYALKSVENGSGAALLIAGGRPRAAIYAVYRYFELFCGCRWFWDGDRIKKVEKLKLSGIDVTEAPRFEYRGLRYFAHRSLHRFQAEHWSLEDWEKELDWLLKKRLNMFMLRIGLDDLYQKAFPDIVSYPDPERPLPEAGAGYDDRSLFWPLEYRGELRKKILEYAFERDLMHPEDCGTMTHWYSRTPIEFLDKVKPALLSQKSGGYNELTGRVWDIRDDKNLENYFKLTETHIREYGRPELFHTIGLAERSFSDDRDENLRLKLYVYRRIASFVKEKYPGAPLLIASWDLWMFYTPEEVRRLIGELDPSQSLILDYTSDTARGVNFTNWGVVGRFPWIFGVFSGFEANSEILGYYELTNERLKIAKADKMCRGMILWPELSHGDTFAGEYLAANAWSEDVPEIPALIEKFCSDRYDAGISGKMLDIWNAFMPVAETHAWSMKPEYKLGDYELFTLILSRPEVVWDDGGHEHGGLIDIADGLRAQAAAVLEALAGVFESGYASDELLRRDLFDIARTVLARYVDFGILGCVREYSRLRNGSSTLEKLDEKLDRTLLLNRALAEVLSGHEDYSLYESLLRLDGVHKLPRRFESTLKNNAENGYCRSFIYENAKYLYVPEMELLFGEVKNAAAQSRPVDKSLISGTAAENRKRYFELPLADMRPDGKATLDLSVREAAKLIRLG